MRERGEIMDRENRHLEYKEKYSKSYLKTVSAFSNYEGGKIIFGVNDEGEVVGVEDPRTLCLNIENAINDNIKPNPLYSLKIIPMNGHQVVVLLVEKGDAPPYYYKTKAYKRNDTSSIEVGKMELDRLVLKGKNLKFEDLPASRQDLSFHTLDSYLKDIMGIQQLTNDILITLGLYKNDQYTIAAEIISDQNSFPGIDIVKFGQSISILEDRVTLKNISILEIFKKTIDVFDAYYSYEEIESITRNKKSRVPGKAFREAIANALVHRSWDIPASINVSMFNDHIEIVSPGGLPEGLSEETYENTNISILRNPSIANLFYRLHYIESFGTGIRRIKEEYKDYFIKPSFQITDHSVTVILPVIKAKNLAGDELKVYNALMIYGQSSRRQLTEYTGFNKSKIIRIVNKLIEDGLIETVGQSRNVTYKII